MKMSFIILLMAATAVGALNLPSRETYRIGVSLLGTHPRRPCAGAYFDYYVNTIGSPWHVAGLAYGFTAWAENPEREIIKRRGVGFTVTDILSSTGSPHYFQPIGKDIWPDTGRIVDCHRRRPARTARTNEHGIAQIGLWWGALVLEDAARLCSAEHNISSLVTGRIGLSTSHIAGVRIGGELAGGMCFACATIPNSVCRMGPDGTSWVGDRAADGTAAMSAFEKEMNEKPHIVQMAELLMVWEEELLRGPDPNRLPQAELEWLDIGWYMLKADNTLSNAYNDEGMLVITFDPNDLRECLSAIDAFVVCLVLDWPGQPSRLSLVVNGRAVVMHRHSGNRYISDYLFITDEPRAVGPQVDNWGNPCYILPQVGDGRIVSAVLPDANMPDVINRWLSDNPYSDLNADGVINFADFALSAAKQYGKVDGLE